MISMNCQLATVTIRFVPFVSAFQSLDCGRLRAIFKMLSSARTECDSEPLEIPAIRDLMHGRVKLLFGLANDELGYIIPKSEWDTQPPYLFGADHAPYGEVNSVGPNLAFQLHSAFRELVGK